MGGCSSLFRLLETRAGDQETATTLEYMLKYGWERVRGGPWCQCALKYPPRELLVIQMATVSASIATNTSSWTIGAPIRNQHNSLQWLILVMEGSKAHPRIQVGKDSNSLRIPFGASQWSTDSKTSLDFSIAEFQIDILQFFEKIDNWILQFVFENQSQFFKKILNMEQLRDNFVGLVSRRDGHEPTLKTKISSSSQIFVMSENGSSKGNLDQIKAGSTACGVIQLNNLWTMGQRFGISCNTVGLMLFPKQEMQLQDLFDTTMAIPVAG